MLFGQENAFVYHWAEEFLARAGILRDDRSRAEDVCMETWQGLLRDDRDTLARFEGRSQAAFKAHLKSRLKKQVIALKRHAFERGGDPMDTPDAAHRGSPTWPDAMPTLPRARAGREAAEKARTHLLTRWIDNPCARRDLLVYCFHFEDGLSAARIAELPSIGLTQGGVEEVILRIRATLPAFSGGMEAEAGS